MKGNLVEDKQTGDPGVLMDHVTLPQAPRLDQDPVIIPHLKMEGPPVLDHHLQQRNVIH